MPYRKQLTALQLENEAIKQNISLLESKATTSKQKELIATLKNINNDFDVYKDHIIALVSEGKKEEAIDLIDESSVPFMKIFLKSFRNIVVI